MTYQITKQNLTLIEDWSAKATPRESYGFLVRHKAVRGVDCLIPILCKNNASNPLQSFRMKSYKEKYVSLFIQIVFLIMLATSIVSCSTDSGSGSYVGNKSTLVFHTSSCRYVSQITDKAYFTSHQDAIDAGYSADKSGACNP